jgi:hypothetical protein
MGGFSFLQIDKVPFVIRSRAITFAAAADVCAMRAGLFVVGFMREK